MVIRVNFLTKFCFNITGRPFEVLKIFYDHFAGLEFWYIHIKKLMYSLKVIGPASNSRRDGAYSTIHYHLKHLTNPIKLIVRLEALIEVVRIGVLR